MLRKFLIIPPVVAGIAVLFFLASNKQEPVRNPPEELARAVRVIEAEAVDLVPRAVGYGTVQPSRVWNATAQVSGEVEYRHPAVKRGAILPEGTEILRISPVDFELAIAQAEANIRSSEAKLAELLVSEENTRATLQLEQRALDLRETELKRKTELQEQGVVAQSVVDQEMRDTLAQRQRVQDLENTLRLIPTQRTVEEEQKAVFAAQLQSAQLDLDRTHVRLPFDGRIAQVNVEETQFAQTGSVLAIVDSVDVAEIEAQVPISRFRMLIDAASGAAAPQGVSAASIAQIVERLGLKVTVRLRDGDRNTEWPGRFARISDTIDPKTRTVGIIAEVDGAYAQAEPGVRPPLAKGFFVEIEISARAIPGQIVVPRAAVVAGQIHVANTDNRLEVRPIETGIVQGDIVSVVSGLEPGERVIVSDLVPAIAGMLLAPEVDAALQARVVQAANGGSPLR